MDCVSQKNAKEGSSFEDPWFSFIDFSKHVHQQKHCAASVSAFVLRKLGAPLSLISEKSPLIILMYQATVVDSFLLLSTFSFLSSLTYGVVWICSVSGEAWTSPEVKQALSRSIQISGARRSCFMCLQSCPSQREIPSRYWKEN